MEALIVVALSFGLLWVLFLLPQQRRVRAHEQLVASLQEGDEVVLSAGIYGRITRLGPEDMDLQIAPGVELRVARQAVLRRVEHATELVDSEGKVAADDTNGTTNGADGTDEGGD